MKIAHVVVSRGAAPSRRYLETHRMVVALASSLRRRGHEAAVLSACELMGRDCCRSVQPLRGRSIASAAGELAPDLVHVHADDPGFTVGASLRSPVVVTYRGRVDVPSFAASSRRGTANIAICDAQRRLRPAANWVATIADGLSAREHPFTAVPGEHLVFVGSLTKRGRVDRAISLARASRRALRIIPDGEIDALWVADVIGDPDRSHLEIVCDRGRTAALSRAHALIVPGTESHPAHRALTEAMAFGTPTIAFSGTHMAEHVVEGVTGFVVDSQPEALDALAHAGASLRRTTRERFEDEFTLAQMVARYEDVYRQVLELGSREVPARRSAETGTRPRAAAWPPNPSPGASGILRFARLP